jgi:hypothetical protein
LPIGNLTSQWFANLYLDPFDRFARQTLRAGGYVRYCDDFCLFSDHKSELRAWIERSAAFLGTRLRLELNAKHRDTQPVRHGLTFLGLRIFPEYRRFAPKCLARATQKLKVRILNERGSPQALAQPWVAYLMHADTWRFRSAVLTRVIGARKYLRIL